MDTVERWIMDKGNHIDCNCFALAIISHGNESGDLFVEPGKPGWDLEPFIEQLSRVETLVGKPKIIVINACRGSKCQFKLLQHFFSVDNGNLEPYYRQSG